MKWVICAGFLEWTWRSTAMEMLPLVSDGIKCANEDHLGIIYNIVTMKKLDESQTIYNTLLTNTSLYFV